MLKMKLPMNTDGEAVQLGVTDRCLEQRRGPAAASPSCCRREPPRPPVCPSQLDKETVYEWFGLHLNPAKRIEFMCGLLHMCQPLELRFLGSYVDDLTKKDYHVLRDFESRANNPGELGVLTDVFDPVVRSKLLVCMSLLRYDSKDCANAVFRILKPVDPSWFLSAFRDRHRPAVNPHGLDGGASGRSELTSDCQPSQAASGPLEQLALLFTMVSLHPAFNFHHRTFIRGQLDCIELALEVEKRQRASTELMGQKVVSLPSSGLSSGECMSSHPTCQNKRSSRWATQREAVHIEGIMLRSISRVRNDKEYNFQVMWSDASFSSVTKTHQELENFLLKLPKEHCSESFEKNILRLLKRGDQYKSMEVEKNLRERFLSAPPVFRQTRGVCSFFNCDTDSTCSRRSCQPGTVYPRDASDASSQEEDLYLQGHKKKPLSRSPSHPVCSAKGSQGGAGRRGPAAERNGPAERRKKGSSQECEQDQDANKRSHPGMKTKSRRPPIDRDETKAVTLVPSGSLGSALSAQRRDGRSVLDTIETSSESYSCPSSPQHRGPGSLDSEDDHSKDTDSHSDDFCKAPGPDVFFGHHSDSAVQVSSVHPLPLSNHPPQMDPLCHESSSEFPPLSFMSPLPYMLPSGASEAGLSVAPLPSHGDMKASSGTLLMQIPPVPPPIPIPAMMGDPEKTEVLPTFGVSPVGLLPPGHSAVQPLVQRFKTALSPSQSGSDPKGAGSGAAAPGASHIRPMGVSPTSRASPLLTCQDPASVSPGLVSSMAHVETLHKLPGLTLPSPYNLPHIPTSIMAPVGAPAPGQVQAGGPPAIPTNAPGPAPCSSPALSHSTVHSDSSSSSSTLSPASTITLQHSPQPGHSPQQPPVSCGTCCCHNNRGSSSLLCSAHQMAVPRQVFGPHLFQLSSLGSNNYLNQANGAATMPTFFPSAPPAAHPAPYLQSHSQSPADVPPHNYTATNYSLQQQIAPAFCQPVYQHMYPNPMGLLPAAAVGMNKKNGNVSCYNCGASGHYAQDCTQPSIDATQQGNAATHSKGVLRGPILASSTIKIKKRL
ncbi:zinc finger CCHC domain-containing protein 2 isoform 2-T2 [Pholidichthys leucotaenia]